MSDERTRALERMAYSKDPEAIRALMVHRTGEGKCVACGKEDSTTKLGEYSTCRACRFRLRQEKEDEEIRHFAERFKKLTPAEQKHQEKIYKTAAQIAKELRPE